MNYPFKVTVLDAKQTSSRLWVDIGPLTSGSRNTGRVTVLNRGCRTAFVYGVVEEQEEGEGEGVWVNPAAVVIPPKQSLDVFVIQNAQNITSHKVTQPNAQRCGFVYTRVQGLLYILEVTNYSQVAQLKLYCGDNLARRRFCHALNHLGSSSICDLPFDPTHEFLGTDPDTEILLPPENLGENDYIFEQKLFLSSIYQLYLRCTLHENHNKLPTHLHTLNLPLSAHLSRKSTSSILTRTTLLLVPRSATSVDLSKLKRVFSLMKDIVSA
eukprot:sb/3468196/